MLAPRRDGSVKRLDAPNVELFDRVVKELYRPGTLLDVEISENDAQRWEIFEWDFPEGTDNKVRRAATGPQSFMNFKTEVSIEDLVAVYQKLEWRRRVYELEARRVAVKLMSNPYVGVTKLARELGVSRQTLHSWNIEARQLAGEDVSLLDIFGPQDD